ncbi:hypothetical protein BDF22DRAFT_49496 [Syncephalis plumigaleata]|nr:hypothetical protein BDF22DRAFT_49496 [Syncephalis plumigaleata]
MVTCTCRLIVPNHSWLLVNTTCFTRSLLSLSLLFTLSFSLSSPFTARIRNAHCTCSLFLLLLHLVYAHLCLAHSRTCTFSSLACLCFTRVRCSPLLLVVVDLTVVCVIIYAFYSSCLLRLPLCCLRCFSTHAHYDHAFILTLFCCNHSPSACSACARQGYRVVPASVLQLSLRHDPLARLFLCTLTVLICYSLYCKVSCRLFIRFLLCTSYGYCLRV